VPVSYKNALYTGAERWERTIRTVKNKSLPRYLIKGVAGCV